LASILATSPDRSVVVVDLDLTLGDADVYLDMTHEYTLADLTQNAARLDFEMLRRCLARHKSGLCLLPRPVELTDAGLVTEEPLRRVFGLLKASYSHVVVDLSKAYSPLDMVALEYCDAVLLVTQLDLSCLRNVVRLLKSFRPVPGLIEKVKLVINRAMPESETIRLKRAEEIVGREFFWQVPNDYRLMVEVCNNGVPLITQAPRAEITQSLSSMSRVLCGEEEPGDKPGGRLSGASPGIGKWFGFWSSGASKSCLPAPSPTRARRASEGLGAM
jgi:pilus assembly protein CpaE